MKSLISPTQALLVAPAVHTARRIFLTLAAADSALIGLSLLQSVLDETAYARLLTDKRLYISHDGGYGEWYQYAKAGCGALALLWRFAWNRYLTLLGWALVFGFILADDALSLHERFGDALLANASLPTVLGLPGQLYVEPLGYVRAPQTRPLTHLLLPLFGALFVFGGLVDMLHAALEEDYAANRYAVAVTALVEDGGEMLILSGLLALIVAYALFQRERPLGSANHSA